MYEDEVESDNLPVFKLGDIAYFKNNTTSPKLIVSKVWMSTVDVFWLDLMNTPHTISMPLECLIKGKE